MRMPHALRPFLIALFGLLGSCGGGGGPGIVTLEAGAFEIDFQLVRADLALTRVVEIANPLDEEAEATLSGETEGVVLVEEELPQTVAAGETVTLTVALDPSTPGEVVGTFTLEFAGATTIQEIVVTLRADSEQPRLTAGTLAVAFDALEVGDSASRTFTVTNASQVTPVELRSFAGIPSGFQVTPALPVTLAPGATQTFTVSYAPGFAAPAIDTSFTLSHSASTTPLVIDLTAASSVYTDQEVVDFGDVNLSNGSTGFLELEVDADAVSITLEANGPSNVSLGLAEFTGPGDTVFENASLTGPLLWTPATEVFTITAPNSDDPDVQLAEGGGTYRFRIFVVGGTPPATLAVRAIVQRRPEAKVDAGVIDLNVFLADGLEITVDDAPDDARLQAILGEADRIFSQRGLRLGDIDYYRLTDSSFDQIGNNAEFRDMLETSSEAEEVRLNLFFVLTAFGNGTLGVAARVTGPAQNGTRHSGVMVDFDFGSTATAGYVTAHELGHYLGLYHTTESNGSHDNIFDTLECPANGTDATCSVSATTT